MKQILKNTTFSGALLMGTLLLGSCTGEFEKWNINPNEVTPDQMKYDNLNTGAYFVQMEKGVFIVGKDMGGEYQITEMYTGDIFAGYIANTKKFDYTTYHNDHYRLYNNWYDAAFSDAYKEVMEPWRSITKETTESSVDRAMATVIKVLGMSRITDMYGPIPYSKFGTALKVPYDSQKDVYYQFFDELSNAIDVMTAYVDGGGAKYMANYDYIFSGDVRKWVKFANTLRLRLAMRISYVDTAKATTEAQAAINHSIGLMTSKDDSAILHQTTSLSFRNPLWEVSESFTDVRMGATMDCYLNGYEDPRLSVYFLPAANDGKYHGVRNGMTSYDQTGYYKACSGLNFAENDGMQWMDASEAYFLQAEAKLRLNIGSETVQEYYENGIRTSFESKGASNVDNYLTSDKTPLETFTDAKTGRSTNVSSMISKLAVAWDESADTNAKLERIMIQKWIALYPDGQEAWSEMRRTGYPGFVRISTYSGVTEVTNNELISRLKFPSTEYSNNAENVAEAVSLLGGKGDIAGTRLWWDVNR